MARLVVGGAKSVNLLQDVWRVCQLIELKIQRMEREGTHQAIGRVIRPRIVDGQYLNDLEADTDTPTPQGHQVGKLPYATATPSPQGKDGHRNPGQKV